MPECSVKPIWQVRLMETPCSQLLGMFCFNKRNALALSSGKNIPLLPAYPQHAMLVKFSESVQAAANCVSAVPLFIFVAEHGICRDNCSRWSILATQSLLKMRRHHTILSVHQSSLVLAHQISARRTVHCQYKQDIVHLDSLVITLGSRGLQRVRWRALL